MSVRFVLSIVLGVAGACALFFGLDHLGHYVRTGWRNRGTEQASDLWIFSASIVVGLALMYPAARFLSERKR